MNPPSPRAGSYQPEIVASAATMLEPGVSGASCRLLLFCRSCRSGRGPRSCRSLRGGRSVRSGRGPRSLRGAVCGTGVSPSAPSRNRLRPRPRRRWNRPLFSFRSPLRSALLSGFLSALRSKFRSAAGALRSDPESSEASCTGSTRGAGGGGAAGAAKTSAAGAATFPSAGAASATTFFGRPRGFFAGAASVDAAGVGAVTTAAGASPVSLYGFGSSPCADLRGERGPRPGAGRRRSVMSSMCYVVTGHGAVRNHRRARRTHAAWHLFGTLTTSRTTPSGSMHGCKTVANKKIRSGHCPKNCGTALETLRRYARRTIVDIRYQS